MKQYKILKDFKGSQDGRFTQYFKAGTEAEMTDYLADIVVREGWAELIGGTEKPTSVEPVAGDPEPTENKVIVPKKRRGRPAK